MVAAEHALEGVDVATRLGEAEDPVEVVRGHRSLP